MNDFYKIEVRLKWINSPSKTSTMKFIVEGESELEARSRMEMFWQDQIDNPKTVVVSFKDDQTIETVHDTKPNEPRVVAYEINKCKRTNIAIVIGNANEQLFLCRVRCFLWHTEQNCLYVSTTEVIICAPTFDDAYHLLRAEIDEPKKFLFHPYLAIPPKWDMPNQIVSMKKISEQLLPM